MNNKYIPEELQLLNRVTAQIIDFKIKFKDDDITNGLNVYVEFRTDFGNVFFYLPIDNLEPLMALCEIYSSEFMKGNFVQLWYDQINPTAPRDFKYIAHAINPTEIFMNIY